MKDVRESALCHVNVMVIKIKQKEKHSKKEIKKNIGEVVLCLIKWVPVAVCLFGFC